MDLTLIIVIAIIVILVVVVIPGKQTRRFRGVGRRLRHDE